LAGVNPNWIYAGPLLAIVTAIGVGIAFFAGRSEPAIVPAAKKP
jgi:hypothetical protein